MCMQHEVIKAENRRSNNNEAKKQKTSRKV